MEALASILEQAQTTRAAQAGWLAERQRDAAGVIAKSGLPTLKHENWKYTSLDSIRSAQLRLAVQADGDALNAAAFAALRPAVAGGPRVVIVNGWFNEALSDLSALPEGVSVTRFTGDDEAAADLGAILDASAGDGFTALNTAAMTDGIVIEAARDICVEQPIAVLFVGAGSVLRSPRIVLRAGQHAQLRVIEQYLSVDNDDGLTNVITNIEADAASRVFHHRLQSEAETSGQIGRIVANVQKDATVHSDSVALGGRLTRIDIDVRLRGRGARCDLNGLFVGHGTQHIDHHTTVEHCVGDTHSRERYRGILDDRSRGVFNGKVIVHKDAQKISAEQASNNLLLSRQAEIDTKPELEIYADDVICAHGATVGELDAAALFYLRSRGIAEADARALLVYAFAQEIVSAIPLAGLRDTIEQRFIGGTSISDLLEGVNT